MTRKLQSILVLLLVTWAAGHLTAQAQTKTTITGIVKNASGEPVEGAMVRVRNPEKGLVFMVVSQAQGRYSTPNLLPGKYTVEAIGGDYQSNAAGPVDVHNRQQEKMDV